MADNKTIPEIDRPKIEYIGKVSTNFYWTYDYNGQVFNNQTTVRDDTDLELAKKCIKTTLELQAYILELGGQAKQVGKQPDQPAAALPTPTPLSEIPGYVPPGSDELPEAPDNFPGTPPPHGGANNTFATSFLVCEIRESKQYFKIKGPPPFHKFGVTVWPEVLTAAGIPVGKLEGKEYKLDGYIATFETVAGSDGKTRQKITHLEKVA